ncbi:MAG: AMP-binding protein [Pseudomonadota bacterium]
MATEVCDVWAEAEPGRTALLEPSGDGVRRISYEELRAMADALAHALADRGVTRGDRVGVLRSQSPWTAAAHIAIWKLGAISLPLFVLFGEQALVARLSDAGAKVVIGDPDTSGLVRGLSDKSLRSLGLLVPEEEGLHLGGGRLAAEVTGPNDPAVLIYTSGTTGGPKGALHGHRVLRGHLPGVQMSHDLLPQPRDTLWTPADWAWIGGLFDVLMPGLQLGVPVVAARMRKFSTEGCVNIIAQTHARNVFFPPTALRALRADGARIDGLRSVASGGEPLGAEMLAWGRSAFGVTINEFYGQTECNMVVSSCSALFPAAPGAMGRPVPGHGVAVIDADGCETEGEGDIAVARGSASMMLEYWNNPDATRAKFRGDWMLTGDRGIWQDGYLRFVGRQDDVITSAGYRIGPAEIEDCLLKHPSVATVGVVGKPCDLRTEIVKAYVVLKHGFDASGLQAEELQNFVKDRLASHSYPREISFEATLPMTVTGKIIRKELKARAAKETCQ